MGQGQASNPFNQVSWQHPFGDSALANATGNGQSFQNAPLTASGADKKTGQQIIDPNTLKDYNTNQGQGPAVPQILSTIAAPTSAPTAPNNNFYGGVGSQYAKNNSEQNFLNSYQQALNPNTNFNINAQTNPLISQAGFKSPTAAGALGNNVAGGK